MALVFGLEQWKLLLAHTDIPVKVFSDYANLAYYCHPQKINHCVARGINTLAQYNFEIIYKLGDQNHTDTLSCRPDYPTGGDDNQGVTTLPNTLFVHTIELSPLHGKVLATQEHKAGQIALIAKEHTLESTNHHWTKNGCPVIPDNIELIRELVRHYHDTITAAHLGTALTLLALAWDFWFPKMKDFVHAYIKGYAICQMSKSNTHPNKPPIFPITPEPDSMLFSTVSMDWITKLPLSEGFDSILTITDHDCLKAVIILPCKEAMTTLDLAKLYAERVFPHYSLLDKIISDRDPQLTSDLARDICCTLGI
jgi:Integrase zinc binding domain